MKKAIFHSLLLAFLGAFLGSCVKENTLNCPEVPGLSEKEAWFQFEITPVTYATQTNDFKTTFQQGDAVGIFAVKRANERKRSFPKATNNYVNNVQWTCKGEGKWGPESAADRIFYPEDGNLLDFYAYYPYQPGNIDPTAIRYLIPLEQAYASDPTGPCLMSAGAAGIAPGNGKKPVKLFFNHLLSLIEVEIFSTNKDFHGGVLLGVYQEAVLNFSQPNTADQLTELKGDRVSFKMETISTGVQGLFRVAAIPQTILRNRNLFNIADASGEFFTWSPKTNHELYSGKKERLQIILGALYRVTFDAQGGSSVAPVNIAKGEILSIPVPNPDRAGYHFLGWYKDAAGTQSWNFSDPINADLLLYAKWSNTDVTLFFDSQGGTPVPKQILTAGTVATLPVPDPQFSGQQFLGWTKDAAGSQPWNFATDVVHETTTLYAQWKAEVYTVTFNPKNGSYVQLVPVEHNQRVGRPLPDPVLEGHAFVGWFKDEAGVLRWDFANEVVTSDITLYGKWEIETYLVTFDAKGGMPTPQSVSVLYNNKVTLPADPIRLGYLFMGWYPTPIRSIAWDFDTDLVKSNMTLYAMWSQRPIYTVDFDTQGGNSISSQSIPQGEKVIYPGEPFKPGWQFVEWNTEPDQSGFAWNFASMLVYQNTTLHAIYTRLEIQHKITYDPTSGDGVQYTEIVNDGDYYTIRTGEEIGITSSYVLLGWSTTADGTGSFYFPGDTIYPNQDLVLYAIWYYDR